MIDQSIIYRGLIINHMEINEHSLSQNQIACGHHYPKGWGIRDLLRSLVINNRSKIQSKTL